MAIKLYDLAGAETDRRFSPYCWRARMALAHKGLEVETIPWRFAEKDAIAFSGQGRVPVLIFAIDPGEIGLPGNIGNAHPVLLPEAMTHRKGDAEPLAVQRANLEPVTEGFRLRHHGEIELAVEKEFREVPGHPFDERHLATGMRGAELGEKAHETHRSDRAHHPEIDRRVVHAQEVHRCRFGGLGLRHHLL